MRVIILTILFTLSFIDIIYANDKNIYIQHKKKLFSKKRNSTKIHNNIVKDIEWGGVENLINWPL